MNQKKSAESFIKQLPEERQESMNKLRIILKNHLPEKFEESVSDDMIHYVIPHSFYPEGYHVNPEQPLPFISLASQKNHIAFYHMGIYLFPNTLKWFQVEYKKRVPTKLDMGKSCIRFKNVKNIPYDLIAELCKKIGADEYIKQYEAVIKSS